MFLHHDSSRAWGCDQRVGRASQSRDALASAMTDLLQVLPDFDTRLYAHLLPSLDRALVTSADLLTLDPVHVAKRALLPAGDVRPE